MKRRFLELTEDDGRRLSWIDWGDPDTDRVVLCVHGLTRNARDFDALAEVLSSDYRVMCVDVAGRGESDRLADPARYQHETYVVDLVRLLDAEGIAAVDWIGTSMGGMIGMTAAADPKSAARVKRLVLNDIGPFLSKAALERIGAYVGQTWRFQTVEEAESHMREAYAPFGPLTDEQWHRLTVTSLRYQEDGGFVPAYDPAIGVAMNAVEPADVALWPLWEAIRCPVLALRGTESDLVSVETARQMAETGPRAEVIEFTGVGHAPALLDRDQIDPIVSWLARKP